MRSGLVNSPGPYARRMPFSVICITQRGGVARRAGTVIQITFSSASRRLGFADTPEAPMKRFCFLALLMVLSSSADAGNSLSFVVGGHRIRIEAPRHCRSPSCVSVSVPGIHQTRRWNDRSVDDDRDTAAPANPAVAAPPPVPAITAASGPAPVAPAAAVSPPVIFRPAAAATQEAAAPPQVQPARVTLPPLPPVQKQAEAVRPGPDAVPQLSRVSHQVQDEPADTPVGDWRTEGKGSVRIAACGRALCGYLLNSSSNDKGEAVLINMKPGKVSGKTDPQWTGSVYSHGSGDIYYGRIVMEGANSLRVEACALGRFYCSANVWSRIGAPSPRLISSRQVAPEPRS